MTSETITTDRVREFGSEYPESARILNKHEVSLRDAKWMLAQVERYNLHEEALDDVLKYVDSQKDTVDFVKRVMSNIGSPKVSFKFSKENDVKLSDILPKPTNSRRRK